MIQIIHRCMTFTALIACCLPAISTSANPQVTDERRDEVLRLLNQAFEIWLESPDPERNLSDECRRFAKAGFRDEAIQCIDRTIAAKPSTQAGNAVSAVMYEYLKAGEHEKGMALIKKYDGEFRAYEPFHRWKDQALDKVVHFYIARNQIDRALQAAGMMTGEFPKDAVAELDGPGKNKWECYSLVAHWRTG